MYTLLSFTGNKAHIILCPSPVLQIVIRFNLLESTTEPQKDSKTEWLHGISYDSKYLGTPFLIRISRKTSLRKRDLREDKDADLRKANSFPTGKSNRYKGTEMEEEFPCSKNVEEASRINWEEKYTTWSWRLWKT
jgi:hypothetical protein